MVQKTRLLWRQHVSNEALAIQIATNLRDRMRKTSSGEIVTFDMLHVVEVILASLHDDVTHMRTALEAIANPANGQYPCVCKYIAEIAINIPPAVFRAKS